MGTTPVTVALVDDYDIVVMGIEHILEQYQDRVVIAEMDTNVSVSGMVDIVLYDSFARPESPLRRHRAAGPPATWLLMSAVIDVRGGSEWPLRGFRSGRRSDLVVAIRSRLHRCQKSSGLTRKGGGYGVGQGFQWTGPAWSGGSLTDPVHDTRIGLASAMVGDGRVGAGRVAYRWS